MGLAVIAIIFAASTGYLLAYPSGTTHTVTSVYTSTQMVSASLASPKAYSVNIGYKEGIGYYLTNGTGFTLYLDSGDTPNSGTTVCSSACLRSWPVFYVANLNLPPGLSPAIFGTITVSGTKILTFNGYPLFYWVSDAKAGDTTGQGIGGFEVVTLPWSSTTTVTTISVTTTTALTASSTTTSSDATSTSATRTTTVGSTSSARSSSTSSTCYIYCY